MKKIENIQKYSGKRETPDEENNINSKENVEKIEDAKDEINEVPPIMQIDYDELPDGVYDFAGLAELQNRRTRPNLRENEKVLKNKNKKEKRQKERKQKKHNRLLPVEDEIPEVSKNIVEEIFQAKQSSEENNISNNLIIEEEKEKVGDILENSNVEKQNMDFKLQNQVLKEQKDLKEEENISNFKVDKKSIENKAEVITLEKYQQKTENALEFTRQNNENIKEKLDKIENEYQSKKENNLETIVAQDNIKKLEFNDNTELVEENQINIPEVNFENLEETNKNLEPRRKRNRRAKSNHIELVEDEEENQKEITEKLDTFFTSSKKFAFLITLFLGLITQISFLATSRESNLTGLFSITMFAISIFLLVNVLEIKNKILVFLISLVVVLVPEYTEIFITGENAIMYSFSVLLAVLSLNLVFVKKNRIISFVLAVTTFAISFKIFQDCMEVFLIISIIKIVEEIFNRKERILNFFIHCAMICAILSVVIFL